MASILGFWGVVDFGLRVYGRSIWGVEVQGLESMVVVMFLKT